MASARVNADGTTPNASYSCVPGYALVNGRITLARSSDKYEVGIYARNMLNQYVSTGWQIYGSLGLLTVGTHTSYKRAIPPADYRLIAAMNPKAAQELDYAHTMLTSPGRAAANCICWAMCWRNWRRRGPGFWPTMRQDRDICCVIGIAGLLELA